MNREENKKHIEQESLTIKQRPTDLSANGGKTPTFFGSNTSAVRWKNN